MRWLLDPRIFNLVILTLYACNIVRWAVARSVGDTVYRIGAFIITGAVTFLMKH